MCLQSQPAPAPIEDFDPFWMDEFNQQPNVVIDDEPTCQDSEARPQALMGPVGDDFFEQPCFQNMTSSGPTPEELMRSVPATVVFKLQPAHQKISNRKGSNDGHDLLDMIARNEGQCRSGPHEWGATWFPGQEEHHSVQDASWGAESHSKSVEASSRKIARLQSPVCHSAFSPPSRFESSATIPRLSPILSWHTEPMTDPEHDRHCTVAADRPFHVGGYLDSWYFGA